MEVGVSLRAPTPSPHISFLNTLAIFPEYFTKSQGKTLHIPNRAVGQRAAIQPYLRPDCGDRVDTRRACVGALALLIII